MSELEKKEEKKSIKSSKKSFKKEKKMVKKVSRDLRKVSKEKEEIFEIRKKRYIFEAIVAIILVVFMLILLCNKTFFREEYKTDNIEVDLPLLTFFIKDNGNEVIFKTLRKSSYLRDYFDSYLSNLTKYNCGTNSFYYDASNQTAIYDISVEKKFVVKTIKVKYANGDVNCLCSNNSNNC